MTQLVFFHVGRNQRGRLNDCHVPRRSINVATSEEDVLLIGERHLSTRPTFDQQQQQQQQHQNVVRSAAVSTNSS